MEHYQLKSEFRRRLFRVKGEIQKLFEADSVSKVPPSCTNLLPALFSLYTYMWCTRWKDMIKRV